MASLSCANAGEIPSAPRLTPGEGSGWSRAHWAGPRRRSALPPRASAGPGWSWPPTPNSASPAPCTRTCADAGRNRSPMTGRWHPAGPTEVFRSCAGTSAPRPASRNPPPQVQAAHPAPPGHPAPATPPARRTPPRPGRKAGATRSQPMRALQQL